MNLYFSRESRGGPFEGFAILFSEIFSFFFAESEEAWGQEYFQQILLRIERQCAAYSFKDKNLIMDANEDSLSMKGSYSPFGLPLSSSVPASLSPLLNVLRDKDDFHVFLQFSSKTDKVTLYTLTELLCVPLHPTLSSFHIFDSTPRFSFHFHFKILDANPFFLALSPLALSLQSQSLSSQRPCASLLHLFRFCKSQAFSSPGPITSPILSSSLTL